jgi:hypothetical protein
LAVETATTQTKPAHAGLISLDFSLVRAGGLGFCSRDFQSPEFKLTPIQIEALLCRSRFKSQRATEQKKRSPTIKRTPSLQRSMQIVLPPEVEARFATPTQEWQVPKRDRSHSRRHKTSGAARRHLGVSPYCSHKSFQ